MRFVFVEFESHFVSAKSPGPELHDALLLIKGEVRHVDPTRALVDRWRDPLHHSRRVDQDVALVANLVVPVGTDPTTRQQVSVT